MSEEILKDFIMEPHNNFMSVVEGQMFYKSNQQHSAAIDDWLECENRKSQKVID